MAEAELLCPKCQAPMRSLERSGVTLERCSECGGVFLDRGELERLEDAEGQGAGPAAGGTPGSAGSAAPSGQALVGELLSLARQSRGGRRRF